MKNPTLRRFAFLLFFALLLNAPSAWARLPKPLQMQGTILAVDMETQTLVFKAGPHLKPLLLEWDKRTEFLIDAKAAGAGALHAGQSAVIYYKRPSFSSPLLIKVVLPLTK